MIKLDNDTLETALQQLNIPKEDYWIQFSIEHNCFHLHWYEDMTVVKTMMENDQQCVDIFLGKTGIWHDISYVNPELVSQECTYFIECRYILVVDE